MLFIEYISLSYCIVSAVLGSVEPEFKSLLANITCKSPVNSFSLSSLGKHHILIAGGIGITPIISMLRHLSLKNESYELHYSVKTDNDLAFKEEIEILAGNNAQFYVTKEVSIKGALSSRLDINSLFVVA